MAVNPCIYCGAEVPEGYGHVCPICETNIKNGVMPRNAVPAISAGCGQVPRNRKFKPIYKPSGRAHEYGDTQSTFIPAATMAVITAMRRKPYTPTAPNLSASSCVSAL